jgi:hypothetical protein
MLTAVSELCSYPNFLTTEMRVSSYEKLQFPIKSYSARRMASSGMLRLEALVRTDISGESSTSIIRVTRIVELGTLAVSSNRSTLRRNTKYFFAACVLEKKILNECQWSH